MVFAWKNGDPAIANLRPADELLGTTSDDPKDSEKGAHRDEYGVQHFGFKVVDRKIKLSQNLMRGHEFSMKVLVNYDHINGPEHGRAILAFYEVPNG